VPVLRELEELSYREVADVLNVPIGTVMWRLAHARGEPREAWDRRRKCGAPARTRGGAWAGLGMRHDAPRSRPQRRPGDAGREKLGLTVKALSSLKRLAIMIRIGRIVVERRALLGITGLSGLTGASAKNDSSQHQAHDGPR
jgi:hypothetical protein